MIAKLAAKALAPIAIDAVSNFAKNKVSGMGAKKRGSKKKKAKKRGRKKRAGGALMPAGY